MAVSPAIRNPGATVRPRVDHFQVSYDSVLSMIAQAQAQIDGVEPPPDGGRF